MVPRLRSHRRPAGAGAGFPGVVPGFGIRSEGIVVMPVGGPPCSGSPEPRHRGLGRWRRCGASWMGRVVERATRDRRTRANPIGGPDPERPRARTPGHPMRPVVDRLRLRRIKRGRAGAEPSSRSSARRGRTITRALMAGSLRAACGYEGGDAPGRNGLRAGTFLDLAGIAVMRVCTAHRLLRQPV